MTAPAGSPLTKGWKPSAYQGAVALSGLSAVLGLGREGLGSEVEQGLGDLGEDRTANEQGGKMLRGKEACLSCLLVRRVNHGSVLWGFCDRITLVE